MNDLNGFLPRYADAELKDIYQGASEELKGLCDRFKKMTAKEFYEKKPNVYLYGLSRRGKTWVFHAIANRIMKEFGEKGVEYISSPRLMHHFVNRSFDDDTIINLASRKVLFVDDLGQEYKSENRFIESKYEEFFRWRFGHNKITFIGSNATLDSVDGIFGGSFANFIDGEYLTIEVSSGDDLSQHFLEDKWK